MNKNSEQPQAEHQETLAERSARLEAEAAAMNDAIKSDDPLAPTAIEEEGDLHDAAIGSDDGEDAISSEQSKAIITALQNEIDTLKDQAVRAMAEAENTRRRAQKDREDASKFAISSFAKDLLDISDNLRRALEAVPSDMLDTEPRLKNFVEGVEATERVLLRSFEKHGIVKINPLDEPFNPNFHEVMFEAPVPGKPAGVVMQVMEPGYTLHERLLRPARVGVTKDDGSAPQQGSESHPGDNIDTSA